MIELNKTQLKGPHILKKVVLSQFLWICGGKKLYLRVLKNCENYPSRDDIISIKYAKVCEY